MRQRNGHNADLVNSHRTQRYVAHAMQMTLPHAKGWGLPPESHMFNTTSACSLSHALCTLTLVTLALVHTGKISFLLRRHRTYICGIVYRILVWFSVWKHSLNGFVKRNDFLMCEHRWMNVVTTGIIVFKWLKDELKWRLAWTSVENKSDLNFSILIICFRVAVQFSLPNGTQKTKWNSITR